MDEQNIYDAYFAGIFDGEGSVTLVPKPNHKTYDVRVQVINTSEWLCYQLYQRYGGWVGIHRRSNDRCKEVYHWYAACNSAKEFLNRILPFCFLKRPQAELALRVCSHKRKGRNQPQEYFDLERDFKELMTQMNKRGVS